MLHAPVHAGAYTRRPSVNAYFVEGWDQRTRPVRGSRPSTARHFGTAMGTPRATNPRNSSVRAAFERQRNDPERVSYATARVSTPKKPDRARTRLTGCPVC